MACIADFDLDCGQRGTSGEAIATNTTHSTLVKFGMDIGLHGTLPGRYTGIYKWAGVSADGRFTKWGADASCTDEPYLPTERFLSSARTESNTSLLDEVSRIRSKSRC